MRWLLAMAALLSAAGVGNAFGQESTYYVYVASEAADKISLVSFNAGGAKLEREIPAGIMPTDIDGPHGLAISPDKNSYYISIAHGQPEGTVWKYSTKDNAPLGRVTLGMFPATLDLTPDGDFLYVVNFNLHGDMVPSSVSIVATEDMTEIARVTTCMMPHGSRINVQGTRHYSACMMEEQLVEIDTQALRASRHFVLTKGQEMGMNGAPMRRTGAGAAAHSGGHGTEPPKPGDISCSPTWAEPSQSGKSVFVACNASSEIVEVDTATWKLIRRIPAGPGVYNLTTTTDGRLLATNRRDQSVSVFDIQSGKEIARVPTKRKVVHGIVASPDDRYAFISVEGIGAEPGTLEVLDLRTLKITARLDLPQQAGGIDFWKIVP
jgi:DNA-binding beta-propeller fold protein YncE